MSKYSAEEVRARFEVWYNHLTQHPYAMAYNNPLGLPVEGDMKGGMWLGYKAAFAERIEADERAVAVLAAIQRDIDALGVAEIRSAELSALLAMRPVVPAPAPPAQAAQVDNKVVVIRDGKSTVEGLVLAAAIYMGAIKDIFKLQPDGPPYNERKVTKDTSALRAFDHLDAATKALRSAISHFTPTAEPVEQVDVGKVREVIAQLREYIEASDDSGFGTLSTSLIRDYPDKLEAALSEPKP